MRAAILTELKAPLVVDEVGLPAALDIGQVFVRVHYSGICGSQLGEIAGVKGEDKYLPHLLGHEAGAVVHEVGPGVRHLKVGDRVVLHWRKGVGIDAAPPSYTWRGKRLNAGGITTFNEYAVVSENRATPVDPALPLDLATLFGCPLTTGLGVVVNNAKLTLGESIVVFGAGGVGLNIIQGAAMVSANPIVAIDLYPDKLELARRLGATHTLDARSPDLNAAIRAIVGQKGADVVVDNTGNVNIIKQCYDLTGPEGRTILVGVPRADQDIQIHSLPLHFGKVLTGSHGGETRPETDIPRYVRLHRAGKLELSGLISKRFGLGQVNEALDAMRRGDVPGRCVIEMPPGP
ncbi:MAG: zinc-binding dehydrogenase [Planctomycetota bacterium]|nr:zinc-binding dehydrogenase [Planctomycetota bacterium]